MMKHLSNTAALLLLLLPAQASAAGLDVQVLAREGAVSVVQMLTLSPGEPGEPAPFPVMTTIDRGHPVVAPRGAGEPGGLLVKTSGAVSVRFDDGKLLVSRDGAGSGPARVQVSYTVDLGPAASGFVIEPAIELGRVTFVTRRTPTYSMQLRPLVPYSYHEESEEDGTWCYMTLMHGLGAGSSVEVSALHLPVAFDVYKAVGGAAALASVVLFLLLALRNGSSRTTGGGRKVPDGSAKR